MKKFSNEEIIQGIRDSKQDVLFFVYQDNYRKILQLVKTNSGNDEDAGDVFQETLIVLYNKIIANQLQLHVAFGTYLYSVARIIWWNELKRRKVSISTDNVIESFWDEKDIIENLELNERHKLVWEYFEKLSSDCQKVIKLFIDGKSISDVTTIMNYNSEQHTKNRKLRCKNSLINNIMRDPRYKELINYNSQVIGQQLFRW